MIKKPLKIALVFCSIFTGAFSASAQQDPLYTNYMFNHITVNPAYTGIYNVFSANFITRQQWAGLGKSRPKTYFFSAHSSFKDNKLGAGLMFTNDRLGVNNNTEVSGTFSYKFPLWEDGVFSFGLQSSLINYGLDYSHINTDPSQGSDPNIQRPGQNILKPNFGSGVMYIDEYIYAGFSVPRILNTEFEDKGNGTIRYRRHFYFSGGTFLEVSTPVQLKPSLLYRVITDAPNALDLNLSALIKNNLWTGITVRNLQAVSVMAQLQLNRRIRLGYSVDLATTPIVDSQFGSHEISLTFDFELMSQHDLDFKYF